MASAASNGKTNTVQKAAPHISSQSDRGSICRRVTRRTMSPADPARATRAAVRNSGSNPNTASRVAGSVPANKHMPKKPSKNPSFAREEVMARENARQRTASTHDADAREQIARPLPIYGGE